MKYLGIDFGIKRIGLAMSDDEGEFAFPHAIVTHTKEVAETIATIALEHGVDEIVIGESLATNALHNDIHKEAEKFVERLGKKALLPIRFAREDFSTVEAHRYQTSAGHRDDSAAAIILQRFLDKKKK